MTGTPINRADHNTFYAFGSEIDENGYLSRYDLSDSIRDGATKELHFEPRLVDLHIDQEAIEAAYDELTKGLTEEDKDKLGQTAAKMAVLVKSPQRIGAICADIAKTLRGEGRTERIRRPGGDVRSRELRALQARARQTPAGGSVGHRHARGAAAKPSTRPTGVTGTPRTSCSNGSATRRDPLKIIIVTSKLLTGFDAPILQTMYLDKPLRDHRASPGHLPDQSALRRAEDARPHRGLPGGL